MLPWGQWLCSAPVIFPWLFLWPAAIQPPLWRRDVRLSLRLTLPTPVPQNWWGEPCVAVQICGLHEGVFSLLFGSGAQVGASLVAHPSVKAVGFTGSQAGGMALMAIAAQRKEPIPVYAEMSSINPVFLLPKALKNRAEIIAEVHVASMLMGAGQFCTSPGLVIGVKGAGLNRYLDKAAMSLVSAASQTMLSPSIHKAYPIGC